MTDAEIPKTVPTQMTQVKKSITSSRLAPIL
jgi:hypothetical protein